MQFTLPATSGALPGQADIFVYGATTCQLSSSSTPNAPKSNCIIDLVRAITILTLKHNFSFTARHIAGLDNSIADSLSHFQMDRFCHLAPNASPSPASSLHQRHQFNSFCLFLLDASLAPATKHSYSVGQNHFISFCLMQGLISPSTPRPSLHF